MLDLLTATTARSPTTTISKAPIASTEKVPLTIGQERDLGSRKEHDKIIEEASQGLTDLYESLKEFLYDLGGDVQERHLKYYVAFRRIKNFACVELRNQKGIILVFVNGNIDNPELIDGFIRDVSHIGHYGTGNIEITIDSEEALEKAKNYIRLSYESA